jgi:two-component system chemotaxis response regulator CheB
VVLIFGQTISIGRIKNMATGRIKVMIVEDSAYMRYVIAELLESDPEIVVVDKARDGIDALEKLQRNMPDVITLDIQMPRMDGLAFLKEMRKQYRIPVIMFSSLTFEGAEDTIKALELGALDFVAKPSDVLSLTIDQLHEQIIDKVKAAARIGARMLAPPPAAEAPAAPAEPEPAAKKRVREKPLPSKILTLKKVVAIGCSTGGPRALTEIIPLLPADLDACVIVVQHMPAKFTLSLAERLNTISEIEVREAQNGDRIRPGVVYIAPGDYHIFAGRGDVLYLNQEAPQHGVRPSVNVFMKSVAGQYGKRAIGAVLTGMGTDGCDGAAAIKEAGGYMFAEHEQSCVVYGMPRAAIEAGHIDRAIILPRMADELIATVYS